MSPIVSYIIVHLKWENRFQVGTDKPKLKVKMQLVSDDYVRKRLLEKLRFELVAKGVFRPGRYYIISRVFQVFGLATGKAQLPTHYGLHPRVFSGNDSLAIFSSKYYQVLTATHLPTPERWKAELA